MDEQKTKDLHKRFCPNCGARYPGHASFCDRDRTELMPVGDGEDLAGLVLKGKYVLIELLGKGSFGSVYRARHILAQADVAIKVLHEGLQDDQKVRKQFLKEARAVMRLQSRHVGMVHDVDETEDGQLFIVMELLRGQSLEKFIKTQAPKGSRLPVRQVVEIVRQICDALHDAHEAGVVHRDLKPANVMVCKDRDDRLVAKVVDFGIARLSKASDTDLTTVESLPRVLGTPAYMSPEQCRAKHVDHRTDLYSLGVMLYEMLAGRRPFEASTVQALIVAHATEDPQPLAKHVDTKGVPKKLVDLCKRLLDKDPQRRPQSAAAVARELQGVASELGQMHPGSLHRTRLFWALGAGVLLLAGLAVAVGLGTTHDDSTERHRPSQPQSSAEPDARDVHPAERTTGSDVRSTKTSRDATRQREEVASASPLDEGPKMQTGQKNSVRPSRSSATRTSRKDPAGKKKGVQESGKAHHVKPNKKRVHRTERRKQPAKEKKKRVTKEKSSLPLDELDVDLQIQ